MTFFALRSKNTSRENRIRTLWRSSKAAWLRPDRFPANQVSVGFALPRHEYPIAIYEQFARSRPRVVVGRQHEAIRTRSLNRDQVAGLQFGHRPAARKEIAGLANRPDYVYFCFSVGLRHQHRDDFVMRLI